MHHSDRQCQSSYAINQFCDECRAGGVRAGEFQVILFPVEEGDVWNSRSIVRERAVKVICTSLAGEGAYHELFPGSAIPGGVDELTSSSIKVGDAGMAGDGG